MTETPGDRGILIIMEPVQPLGRWVTLGKPPLNLSFSVCEMGIIAVPAS